MKISSFDVLRRQRRSVQIEITDSIPDEGADDIADECIRNAVDNSTNTVEYAVDAFNAGEGIIP